MCRTLSTRACGLRGCAWRRAGLACAMSPPAAASAQQVSHRADFKPSRALPFSLYCYYWAVDCVRGPPGNGVAPQKSVPGQWPLNSPHSANDRACVAGTSGDNGLYDSARSVTARHQEAHQEPADKPVGASASFQQATSPARSASAAPFGSGAGPIHAWAGPLKSAGSMQPSGAPGLRSYASSPSWGKGPSLADGLQGRRTAVAREFQSTEHASSIKLA